MLMCHAQTIVVTAIPKISSTVYPAGVVRVSLFPGLRLVHITVGEAFQVLLFEMDLSCRGILL